MPADFSSVREAGIDVLQQELANRAQRLRNGIVEELSRPGTGRTYRTGHRTAPHSTHQASAPGESPAVNTGRLRQSITALRISPMNWRVGTNVDYALHLEFGTRRMAPARSCARQQTKSVSVVRRERALRRAG
ncbi:hypothetical protein MSS93_16455 [Deinococcus radiodurans]|nr:hypothetical protein MSS93_16455 [Deinococcus radiodurans]